MLSVRGWVPEPGPTTALGELGVNDYVEGVRGYVEHSGDDLAGHSLGVDEARYWRHSSRDLGNAYEPPTLSFTCSCGVTGTVRHAQYRRCVSGLLRLTSLPAQRSSFNCTHKSGPAGTDAPTTASIGTSAQGEIRPEGGSSIVVTTKTGRRLVREGRVPRFRPEVEGVPMRVSAVAWPASWPSRGRHRRRTPELSIAARTPAG
jgi:hypothetical protein